MRSFLWMIISSALFTPQCRHLFARVGALVGVQRKKCPPGPACAVHVAVRPSRWLVRRIQRFGCFLGKLVFAVMTLVSTVISRAPRHPGRSLVLLLLAAKDASTVSASVKSGSSRGGFAGSRGHDSSKEVNHGSFAPRTSQIHAELAEIDHARHQNGVRSVTLTVGRLILLYKEPFLSLTKHEEDPLAIFIMTVVCLC